MAEHRAEVILAANKRRKTRIEKEKFLIRFFSA
jgi:hypothetical protein